MWKHMSNYHIAEVFLQSVCHQSSNQLWESSPLPGTLSSAQLWTDLHYRPDCLSKIVGRGDWVFALGICQRTGRWTQLAQLSQRKWGPTYWLSLKQPRGRSRNLRSEKRVAIGAALSAKSKLRIAVSRPPVSIRLPACRSSCTSTARL